MSADPWAPLDAFDLIVTTPQYALPSARRPAHRGAHASGRLQLGWPQPQRSGGRGSPDCPSHGSPSCWAAMSGAGPSASGRPRAHRTRRRHGRGHRRLAADLDQRPHPGDVVDAVRQDGCSVPHRLYRWRPDDPDNPYLGFLALAERIIVTSDSMSMLVEAIATGKPVFVFDLGGRDAGGSGFLPKSPGADLVAGPLVRPASTRARRDGHSSRPDRKRPRGPAGPAMANHRAHQAARGYDESGPSGTRAVWPMTAQASAVRPRICGAPQRLGS